MTVFGRVRGSGLRRWGCLSGARVISRTGAGDSGGRGVVAPLRVFGLGGGLGLLRPRDEALAGVLERLGGAGRGSSSPDPAATVDSLLCRGRITGWQLLPFEWALGNHEGGELYRCVLCESLGSRGFLAALLDDGL